MDCPPRYLLWAAPQLPVETAVSQPPPHRRLASGVDACSQFHVMDTATWKLVTHNPPASSILEQAVFCRQQQANPGSSEDLEAKRPKHASVHWVPGTALLAVYEAFAAGGSEVTCIRILDPAHAAVHAGPKVITACHGEGLPQQDCLVNLISSCRTRCIAVQGCHEVLILQFPDLETVHIITSPFGGRSVTGTETKGRPADWHQADWISYVGQSAIVIAWRRGVATETSCRGDRS